MVFAAGVCLACVRADTGDLHGRDAFFPQLPADAQRLAFPPEASLHVLYWPAGGCLPCNLPAVQALSNLVMAHPEISVTIVLPQGFPSPVAPVGMKWPGQEVILESGAFRRQMRVAPLPRIEVWDPHGQLLLLRSLPPNAAQAAALGDEILWAKAPAKPAKAEMDGNRR